MVASAYSQLGTSIIRECFGSNLQQQGRGFFLPLELFAIMRGQVLAGNDLLDPSRSIPPYRLVSHDFARRLAASPAELSETELEAVDLKARGPLAALLTSLGVDIPGQRKKPEWVGFYLYPYIGNLIHYDAARKRGRDRTPNIERVVLRGGGVLAYEILRTDPEPDRLGQNRMGLLELVEESSTALAKLATALHAHDSASDVTFDDPEVRHLGDLQNTRWLELLREGVRNITSRSSTPRAQRVEFLMHWVPYCIARHQLDIASNKLGLDSMVMLVDFGEGSSSIRRRSRDGLDSARWHIVHALQSAANAKVAESTDEEQREQLIKLAQVDESWFSGPRAFFSETLAAVGALNAVTGKRHFTIQLPLLEAIVHATLPPGTELELEDFLHRILYQRMNLIVDDISATQAGLSADIDIADFQVNADQAMRSLRGLGLLSEFSDKTRMVRAEVD